MDCLNDENVFVRKRRTKRFEGKLPSAIDKMKAMSYRLSFTVTIAIITKNGITFSHTRMEGMINYSCRLEG